MNRQECNLKIADILLETDWETECGFGSAFKELAKALPEQRAGQILCNYICSDYRDTNSRPTTVGFLNWLFPSNEDPFFEESQITLKRLTNKLKSINKEVGTYYELDDILQLDLDKDLRKNIKDKFGKLVFFDLAGICKIGELCGIKNDYKLGTMYYIINSYGKELFIPIYKSITAI